MGLKWLAQRFVSLLLGSVLVIVSSSGVSAQTTSSVDTPTFNSDDGGLWGPQQSVFERTFREEIIDIDIQGTLNSFVGVDVKSEPATLEGNLQFICPEGSFPDADITSGACYSCPDGYIQDPTKTVDTPGVCFKLSDFTTADREGGSQFICPAGQFPDALLQNCYSCPNGYTQDIFQGADSGRVCKLNTTATYEKGNALFCNVGDFWNASITACYYCSSGFTQDTFRDVNDSKVCYDVRSSENCENVCWVPDIINGGCVSGTGGRHKVCGLPTIYTVYQKANFRNNLGCDGNDFIAGNSCYSCPSGTSHNGLLSVDTPGVCTASTSATRHASPGFICNAGEFLDTQTGACFSCPTGYSHNPALFASTPGACFKKDDIVAQSDGDEGFICPVGQFEDLVTQQCYSCPSGYDWNPAVGVNQSGACVNWSSLNVVGNPEDASFEVGFAIDYDIQHINGIEGGISADSGSVQVDYTPEVEVSAEPVASTDGLEHFRINTQILNMDEGSLSMSTQWPRVDMEVDIFSDYDYLATSAFRYVELNELGQWVQRSTSGTIINESTGGEVNPAGDDPLLHFGLGGTGIDLQVAGVGVENYTDGFDPPIELTDKFFKKKPDPYNYFEQLIGTPVVEFGLTPLLLDTPVDEEPDDILDRDRFRALFSEEIKLGMNAGEVSIQHKIQSSDRSGFFRIGVLGGSAQETDVLRMDLDIDGLSAVAFNYLAPGYKLSIPSPIPLVDYASFSASVYDIDLGMVLSLQTDYKFEPNLEVVLQFSPPVRVKDVTTGSYQRVSSARVTAGASVELIHPGGELEVTPLYSLSRNLFSNNTDLMLTPIGEVEVLTGHMIVMGVPPSDLPKATVLKNSLQISDPIKLADLNFYDTVLDIEEWKIQQGAALDGKNAIEVQQAYDAYRKNTIDIASFSLRGFADAPGSTLQLTGSNEQPVARCQDASLALDNAGNAALAVAQIDDGSSDFDGQALASISLSQSLFSCVDLGIQPVTLSAIDAAGAEATCLASVTTWDSLAPVGELPDHLILNEGEVYQFATDISDNCNTITYNWSFANGQVSTEASPEHVFCTLGDQGVAFTADDGQGNILSKNIPTIVANLAPIVEAGGQLNGVEGLEVSLDGAGFIDAGLFAHQAWIDWGDGGGMQIYTLSDPGTGLNCGVDIAISGVHTYVQDGDYTLTLRVQDVGGAVSEDTTLVRIINRAPVIQSVELIGRPNTEIDSGLFIYSGDALDFNLKYSDEGVDDQHTLRIVWDGFDAPSVSSLFDLGISAGKSGDLNERHRFFKPGQYALRFILEDANGGQHEREVSLQVKPLTIQMDVMPEDLDNLVSPDLKKQVEVILFGGLHETGVFDARDVDVDTLEFGSSTVAALRQSFNIFGFTLFARTLAEYDQFDSDDSLDVKVRFDLEALGLKPEDRSISLRGQLEDGRYFEARSRLNIAAARADFTRMLNAILMLLQGD